MCEETCDFTNKKKSKGNMELNGKSLRINKMLTATTTFQGIDTRKTFY